MSLLNDFCSLIQKILVAGEKMQKASDKQARERDLWPRVNIYCRGHFRSNWRRQLSYELIELWLRKWE